MGIQDSVSRRSLLKGGAVAALTMAAAGATAANAKPAGEIAWDREVEVVVVGAGGGGLLAGIELKDAGVDVLLIDADEAQPALSSAYLCGGYLTMCETDMEPGSREELYADLIAESFGGCNEAMVRAYVDNAPELYQRLVDWGVKFDFTEQIAGMSKPWAHIIEGNHGYNAIIPMYDVAVEKGVEMLASNRARHLFQDADGRVIGVEVETPEGVKAYKATKGVILTCGGFTRNTQLAMAFGPKGSESIRPQSGMYSNGDGLIMGLEVGAGTDYLGCDIQSNAIVGDKSSVMTLTWLTCGAINVNINGVRFHDEADNYAVISNTVLDQPEYIFFQIYDTPMRHLLEEWKGLPYFGVPIAEPEITADTIEGLADAIVAEYPHFNKEAFLQTVENYNGYVAAGEDPEFGRAHIQGDWGDLLPIAEGPFFCIPSVGATTLWNGGLRMDGESRVVTWDDEPIPGLYAAGEVTGGLSGYGYMSGTNIGRSMILGTVAARTLMADNQ